jgi:[acyl-carrier-protein] S-malonyltransferase
MMGPASEKLKELLLSAGMKYPREKIYSNVTAEDMMSGFTKDANDKNAVNGYISEIMARQLKSPVYWQETIENMSRDGAEAIIEAGPGKTLFGLVKKINKDVIPLNVEDKDSLRKLSEY